MWYSRSYLCIYHADPQLDFFLPYVPDALSLESPILNITLIFGLLDGRRPR